MSSLVKKYLMALTGLILSGFVFVHMLGNLQVFMPPSAINAYAYFLHHMLPWEVLWGFRFTLLAAVVVHVWTAVQLKIENAAARPQTYHVNATVVASTPSRYMAFSGVVMLAFIVFHILHYTVRSVYPEFSHLMTYNADGEPIFDAYAMMVYGFSSKFWFVSAFYIVSMAALALHLSHGVSSMFQSLGLRNETWRYRLDKFAALYGVVIFLGFASIPAAVLISEKTGVNLVRAQEVVGALESWDGQSPIYIEYSAACNAVDKAH